MRLRLLPYGTLLAAFALFIVSVTNAQVLPRDAAGVRIFRNPDGVSALDWYNDQCGKPSSLLKCGKPAPIIVDGYDGIRDGATVYVNVANKTAAGTVFTNIYLISFAQGSSAQGAQVYDQLFKNWKFNTNIIDPDARAALRRDTRRRATLLSLRRALAAYKTKAGKYPDLVSGSYIRGVTFSSWPSWQQSFGVALGGALPTDPGRPYRIPDPQNPGKETIVWKNFVGCGAPYDATTCWDAKAVKMACPSSAYVYAYRALANAQDYALTTTYESAVVPEKWASDQDQHDVIAFKDTIGCTVIVRSADTDTDGDGVKDSIDNCPDIANAGSADTDRDGKGDVCDTCPYDDKNDADGDGLCADRDSCPTIKNLGIDKNNNGIDAACDTGELCGNGRVNASVGEECDLAAKNGTVCTAARNSSCQYCSNSCTFVTVVGERCGDTIRNGGEQCDGQEFLPGVTCLNGTRSCAPSSCTIQCSTGAPVYPVKGSAWNANIGWIAMQTASSGVGIDLSNRFNGFAWSANMGWVDMTGARVDPGSGAVLGIAQGNSLLGTVLMNPSGGGVKIQPATGNFSGQAWSAQAGWINFGAPAGEMTTAWKP